MKQQNESKLLYNILACIVEYSSLYIIKLLGKSLFVPLICQISQTVYAVIWMQTPEQISTLHTLYIVYRVSYKNGTFSVDHNFQSFAHKKLYQSWKPNMFYTIDTVIGVFNQLWPIDRLLIPSYLKVSNIIRYSGQTWLFFHCKQLTLVWELWICWNQLSTNWS